MYRNISDTTLTALRALQEKPPAVVSFLKEVDRITDDDPDGAITELAREIHGSSEINIDDDGFVSVGDDGAWVLGWLFVPKDRIPGWGDEDDEA